MRSRTLDGKRTAELNLGGGAPLRRLLRWLHSRACLDRGRDVRRRHRQATFCYQLGFDVEVAKIVEGWVNELRPNGELGLRDGKGYFTLHQNNLRNWFARFGLDKKPGWVALRHVRPEEARTLAPGLDVSEGSSFGDVRIAVPALAELHKLRSALMAAYEREASRVGDDPADAEAR